MLTFALVKQNNNILNNKNMKELIIKSLDEAFEKLAKIAPQAKNVNKQVNIKGLTLGQIQEIIKENNIPINATIDEIDDREKYDWGTNEIGILWYVEKPTTNDDILEFMRKDAWGYAFKAIHKALTENGYKYKRVGFGSQILAEFDCTTVYDMYINKDWERLVKYYSLQFEK